LLLWLIEPDVFQCHNFINTSTLVRIVPKTQSKDYLLEEIK
jgi:hypothetical protein